MSFSEQDKYKSIPSEERDSKLNFVNEILKESLILDIGRLNLQVNGDDQENVSLEKRIERVQALLNENINKFEDRSINPDQVIKIRTKIQLIMKFLTPIVVTLKDMEMDLFFEQIQMAIIERTIETVTLQAINIPESDIPGVLVETIRQQILKENNPNLYIGLSRLIEDPAFQFN